MGRLFLSAIFAWDWCAASERRRGLLAEWVRFREQSMSFPGCFAPQADMLNLVKQQNVGNRDSNVLEGRAEHCPKSAIMRPPGAWSTITEDLRHSH